MLLLTLFVLVVLGRCEEAEETEGDREFPLMVFSQVMILPSNESQTAPGDQTAGLERVVGRAVVVARCEAGCLAQFPGCEQAGCEDCRTVCRLLVETPAWTNICSAPAVCGPGCRAACQSLHQTGAARPEHPGGPRAVWDIKQFGCTLIWEREGQRTEDLSVMYLVAAVDADQMFYHLATVSATNIVLDANIASKAETFIILAIGQEGILERHEVEVEQGSCQSSLSSQSARDTEETSSWTIPVAVLSSVIFLLVLLLVLGTFVSNLHRRTKVSYTLARARLTSRPIKEEEKFYRYSGSGQENIGVKLDEDFYVSSSVLI